MSASSLLNKPWTNIYRIQQGVELTLNIFEGARRVALACGGMAIAAVLFVAAAEQPSSELYLEFAGPKTSPKAASQCKSDYPSHAMTVTEGGATVNAVLCFPTIAWDGGGHSIVFDRYPDGRLKLVDRDSTSASEQIAEVATALAVEARAISESRALQRQRVFDHWTKAATIAAGISLAGWFATWVVGWIVRGFLGIPRGSDAKPTPSVGDQPVP